MESGRIEGTSTAELLRQHAQAAASGCLRIERDAVEAKVWFRDGLIYTATAPEARPRLGDRLVGAGHITEDQLLDTLQLQRSSAVPRRIGELLIEQGFIDRETMRTYVREQIADSVAAAMSWTTGAWTFTQGDEIAEDVALDMSVENLLMEGSRRLEEWEVITSRLGSVDAVVDFAPGGSQADLSLTPDEWSMLTHIDGVSTVREIAMDSGYGQFEAARIIYGLLTAGVVRVLTDDEEAPETAESVEDELGADDGADDLYADFTALPEEEPASQIGDFAADLAGLSDAAPPPPPAPGSGSSLEDQPAASDAPAPASPPDPWAAPAAPEAPAPGAGPAPPQPGGDPFFPAPPPPAGQEPPAHPAETADEPAPTEREPRRESAPGQVDRNELLQEFAALDDEYDDQASKPRPRSGEGSAPNGARSRSVPAPEDDERDEDKKGFFGRFRKG
ncbi:MAG TPA: DUF4388 domain-containing protein [Egibacteraceae bacterium]|nr:DUF4388 domain-containing protein [Egibacteraceae bacterium]